MADKEKAMTKDSIVKSQSEYKGNNHFDLVEVKIISNNGYYKAGQTDKVHPTIALILEQKGLIASGWEKNVVERDSSAPLLTDIQVQEVLEGDRDINSTKK